MKTKIKLITAVSIGMILTGGLMAKDLKPKVETDDLKTLRQQSAQLRIAKVKLAAKYGRISTARAQFIIKRITFMNQFKDNNPEWIAFSRRHRKWKRGFRGRRGMRRGERYAYYRKHRRMKRWGQKLVSEPADMKVIRHKRMQVRISKIRFAAKKGFISQELANYKIKKIKAVHSFKDANPEWVRYKRRFHRGRGGRRHGRYGRGGGRGYGRRHRAGRCDR